MINYKKRCELQREIIIKLKKDLENSYKLLDKQVEDKYLEEIP